MKNLRIVTVMARFWTGYLLYTG